MTPKYKVGDWVRFYRNAEFIVGVIQYIPDRPSWQSYYEYYTDKGAVSESSILEAR